MTSIAVWCRSCRDLRHERRQLGPLLHLLLEQEARAVVGVELRRDRGFLRRQLGADRRGRRSGLHAGDGDEPDRRSADDERRTEGEPGLPSYR